MIAQNKITDEVKSILLVTLIVMWPFILYVIIMFTVVLYTPSMITGTVQIITDVNTNEPYQIVLRVEGDNILGDKDFWLYKNFDAADEIIFERENITDDDKVVFNRKGIIQYRIDE